MHVLDAAQEEDNEVLSSTLLSTLMQNGKLCCEELFESMKSVSLIESMVKIQSLLCRGEFEIFDFVLKRMARNESTDKKWCSVVQKKAILSHIDITRFSEDDLKYVIQKSEGFATDSSMRDFQISCMRQLSLEKFSFERTCCADRNRRPKKPRNSRVFTFKHYVGTIKEGPSVTEAYYDDKKELDFWVEIENHGDRRYYFQLKSSDSRTVPKQPLFYDGQIFIYKVNSTNVLHCGGTSSLTVLDEDEGAITGYVGATVYY